MTTQKKPHVIIYGRPGCHLCEVAKQVIRSISAADAFSFDEVNIEGNAELLQRYRHDIPVITIDGVEAFRHRLTAEEFREAIDQARSRSG